MILTVPQVTPLDQKYRDYNASEIGNRLPAVIAGDLVGTVVKTRLGAAEFPIGLRVFSQSQFSIPAGSGLQEYTVVDSRFTALVPKGISDEDAAAFPTNAFTSVVSLFSNAGLGIPFPGSRESKGFGYQSQKLVIVGGGSNTGRLALQFAKVDAIGSIVTIASLSSEKELKDSCH